MTAEQPGPKLDRIPRSFARLWLTGITAESSSLRVSGLKGTRPRWA